MLPTPSLAGFDVPRETIDRLETLVELVRAENEVQNLVSRSSLEDAWARHIVDSAQLIRFAPASTTTWLDLGTGAGFPGLVVAMLHRSKTTLVESRRLRADFLHRAASALAVETELICAKIEKIPSRPFDVISARAFAPLDKLLSLGERFSTSETVWIQPKGRNAKSELEAVRASWQGDFRLEPSLTDAEAQIIVATKVRRISKGKRSK